MRGPKAMLENPMKQKTVLRRISAVVVFFFGATSVLGDTRLYAQSLSVPSVRELEGMADVLEPVQVPAELGSLKEYFQPAVSGAQPFIFHIQDAHANPDAQEKIKALLDWIHSAQKDAGAPKSLRIALEGSADALHPEYLEFFPEYAQVNESIVSDLLHKGELNGVELFAWDSYKKMRSGALAKETPVEIVGAENADLYRENLKTYRTLVFEQEELGTMMAPVDTALEVAKSKVFSPELRDFVRERQRRKFGDYDNGSSSPQLAAYLTYLASEVKKNLQIDLNERFEQVRFPNLVRLLVVGELDPTIEPRRAREQKEKAIHALTTAARTEQEKKLVSLFSSLDSGMPARRITERAWEFAAANGISLSGYGEYLKQLGSVILRSEIDSAALFDEVDILESWLIARLTGSEQERELIRLMDDIHLVEKLFQLKWTPSDYAKYQERSGEIAVSLFGTRLGELAGKSVELRRQDLEKAIAQALGFYEGARERDRVLLDNALRNAPRTGATVLVTGGFHTEGLTRLMKERNIGYAVIQPRILKTDGGELYHKVLREETSDVSAYFEGSALDTQEAVFFKSLLEAGVPDLWEKYQVPHSEIGSKVAEAANRHPILREVLHAAAETAGSGSSVRFDLKNPQGSSAVESQGIMVAARLQSNASFNREYAPVSFRRPTGALQARRTATLDIRPAGTIIGTREGSAVTLPFDELRSLRDQVRKEIALVAFKAARGEDPSSSESLALSGRAESFLNTARSLTGAVVIGPARDTFQSELSGLEADLQQLKGVAAPQPVRAELRTSNLPENVEYIRQLLNPATREWPYDVEIISNTSEDERALREEELKAMTRGKIGPSGQPVRVVSIIEQWNKVVEPGKGGAGNLLGTVNIYREVVSALSAAGDTLTIDDQGRYTLNGQVVKLRHILNGGRAKRMNGLNQTEHSSRGSTSVFGDLMYRVDEAGTTIDRRPLTLFALVAATHAPFGKSNDGTYIDDVYAGQVMVPSADVQNIPGNGAAIVKFAQELKGSAVTLRNLTDLGVYEASPAGEIIESRPKGSFKASGVVSVAAATTWLATHRGLYSLGSHRVSGRLLRELSNFYDGVLTGSRDINREPPEFIKPMAILLKEMKANVSAASVIAAMPVGAAVTDAHVDQVFGLLPALEADMQAAISAASSLPSGDAQKKADAEKAKYREVVKIFLQYRNEIGPNWLGVYDFGSDSYWDRYRRPLEYANSNFILLSLFGNKVELNENGDLVDQSGKAVTSVAPATALEEQQARDYAALRNITHPITNSWIGGIYIDDEGRDQLGTEVTFDDVKNGITIGAVDGIPGVFVKGSIIRNSEIVAGSSVTNSLVQNTSASIQAENSFVHGTLAKNIAAQNSLVYNVVTGDDINEKGFSILGIQRPQLPAVHGHQIIVRQNFAYPGDKLHAIPFNDVQHGTNFAPGYADTELKDITYEVLNRMSEASSKDQNLGVRRTLWQSIQAPLGRQRSELRAEEPEPVKPAPGLKPVKDIPTLLRAAVSVLRAKKVLSPEEETRLLNTPDELLKRRPDLARFTFTVPLQRGTEVKAESMTLPQLLAHFRGQPIPAAPAPIPATNEKTRLATRIAVGVIGGIVIGVSLALGIGSLIGPVNTNPVENKPKQGATARVEPKPVLPPEHPLEAEYQRLREDVKLGNELFVFLNKYIEGQGYQIVDASWVRANLIVKYFNPRSGGSDRSSFGERTMRQFESEFNEKLPVMLSEGRLRKLGTSIDLGSAQNNDVRLTQAKALAARQANYFDTSLLQVDFIDLSGKSRLALVPTDHLGGDVVARYSQPLAISIWGKILADMVEGDIPAQPSINNPVQALEDLVDLRLSMQKEFKMPVWIQFKQMDRLPGRSGNPNYFIVRDPTRKTVGVEDINGDFGLTIPTIGALLSARDLPANAAKKDQINRIIEKHVALVKGFAPVYAKLYNPDRKMLAGELDVISGERVIARHKDRLVEDRAPIALAVAAGFIPQEAFTSVKLVTGTYRDRNGKEYTVLRPWDGGAFQEGYNGMYGVERLFGTMRKLRANTAAAFIDLSVKTRKNGELTSYFPGAAYIDKQYVAKAGHPNLKETGEAVQSDFLVPANGLAFGDVGFVLDHYNSAVNPLAFGRPDVYGGLLPESYVWTPKGYRASPIYSTVIVGPSVIVLGNNGDISNDALVALESKELGLPNALNILKGLYTPASLGLTVEPVLAPGIPAGEGTPEAFTVPVVPPKGGDVKPVEKVVPPVVVVPAADDLIGKATAVGIFTQVDSFPGNKAERSPGGVTIDYTLAGANRLTGAFLKFDNLDLTGVPTLTVQIGEKPADKLPAKINVLVKVPGQTYTLKLKGQVLAVAADVKAGAKIEYDLPAKLAGKVQEITIEIEDKSVGANKTGSFSVTAIIPAKAVGVVPPKGGDVKPKAPADAAKKTVGLFAVELPADANPFEIDKNLTNKNFVAQRDKVNPIIRAARDGIKAKFPEEAKKAVDSEDYVKAVVDFFHLRDKSNYKPGEDGYTPPFDMNDVRNFATYVKNTRGDRSERELILIRYVLSRWAVRELAEGFGVNITGVKNKVVTQADVSFFADRLAPLLRGEPVGDYGRSLKTFIGREFRDKATRVPPKPADEGKKPELRVEEQGAAEVFDLTAGPEPRAELRTLPREIRPEEEAGLRELARAYSIIEADRPIAEVAVEAGQKILQEIVTNNYRISGVLAGLLESPESRDRLRPALYRIFATHDISVISDLHATVEGATKLAIAVPNAPIAVNGDFVDRGPYFEQMMGLGDKLASRLTLGNHDLVTLGAFLGDISSFGEWLRWQLAYGNDDLVERVYGLDIAAFRAYAQRVYGHLGIPGSPTQALLAEDDTASLEALVQSGKVEAGARVPTRVATVPALAALNIHLKAKGNLIGLAKIPTGLIAIDEGLPAELIANVRNNILPRVRVIPLTEGAIHSVAQVEAKLLESGINAAEIGQLRQYFRISSEERALVRDLQIQISRSRGAQEALRFLQKAKIYDVIEPEESLQKIDRAFQVVDQSWQAHPSVLLIHAMIPVNEKGDLVDLQGNVLPEGPARQRLLGYLDSLQARLDQLYDAYRNGIASGALDEFQSYLDNHQELLSFINELAMGYYSPFYLRNGIEDGLNIYSPFSPYILPYTLPAVPADQPRKEYKEVDAPARKTLTLKQPIADGGTPKAPNPLTLAVEKILRDAGFDFMVLGHVNTKAPGIEIFGAEGRIINVDDMYTKKGKPVAATAERPDTSTGRGSSLVVGRSVTAVELKPLLTDGKEKRVKEDKPNIRYQSFTVSNRGAAPLINETNENNLAPQTYDLGQVNTVFTEKQSSQTPTVFEAARTGVVNDLQAHLSAAVQAYVAEPSSEHYQAVQDIVFALASLYGPQDVYKAIRGRLLDEQGGYLAQVMLRYSLNSSGQKTEYAQPVPVRDKIPAQLALLINRLSIVSEGVSPYPGGYEALPDALRPSYEEPSREAYITALGVKAVVEGIARIQQAVSARDITEALADLAEVIDAHRVLTTSSTGTAYEARRAAEMIADLPDIFNSFGQYAGIIAASPSASVDFGTSLDLADLHERIRIQVLPSLGLVLADHQEFKRFVALVGDALATIQAERNELRTQLLEGDLVELSDQESVRLQIQVAAISRRTGEVSLQLTAVGQPVEIYRNRDNLTTPEITVAAGQTVPLILAERDAVYLNAERETSFRLSEIEQVENEPVAVIEALSGELRRLDSNAVRNELREIAPELPPVAGTQNEVARQIRSILFPADTTVPEISTAGTINRIRPVVDAQAEGKKRISTAAREVAREASQTIYDKAEDLSRQLGIGVDEALAVVVDEILEKDISDKGKFDLALRAFREALGPELAEDLVKTGIQPMHFAPRVRSAGELKQEENQLLIAFKLMQAPQDKITIYYAPAEPSKPGEDLSQEELDDIKEEIAGQVTRLGGNAKTVIENLTLRKVDEKVNLNDLRTAIVNAVVKGKLADNQPAVLDDEDRFLGGFPIIPTGEGRYLGRVKLRRELSLSKALMLMPAVELGQEVIDMLMALESKGYSRADISSRLTRFAKALEKIASAA